MLHEGYADPQARDVKIHKNTKKLPLDKLTVDRVLKDQLEKPGFKELGDATIGLNVPEKSFELLISVDRKRYLYHGDRVPMYGISEVVPVTLSATRHAPSRPSSTRPNFFPPPAPLPPPSRASNRTPLPSDPPSASRKASKLPMAVLLAQHRAQSSSSSSSSPLRSDCDSPLLPPVPEHVLLRDILYVFQGIDGQFVRFRAPPPPRQGPKRTYVRGEIVSSGPGVAAEPPAEGWDAGELEQTYENGIRFDLTGSGYGLPAPTRALLHQLSELGWLYRKIEGALQESSEARLLAEKAARKEKGKGREGEKEKRKKVGMVEQSLHAELKKEMTEYFRLVALFEAKLEGVESDEEEQGEEGNDVAETAKGLKGLAMIDGLEGVLTLRKLDVWTQDVRLRMRMMGTLIAEVGGSNVGGAFLSLLHAYTTNGDPFISSFSSRLLQTLSVPFFSTLSSWIYDGELRDPYDEFFVALNPALDGRGDERWKTRAAGGFGGDEGGYGGEAMFRERSEEGVAAHELWAEKFEFRKEMLPSFLEEAFGKKIFSTGKSLNFLKYSCEDVTWVVERNREEDRTLQYVDMASLERSISLAYSKASERLWDLFFDKFLLLDHLRTLKDYLMLGKGDFVEILMEQLGPSLSKPANTLYRHNLTSTLETAILGSTPPSSPQLASVLRRLDARMLDFEQGQVGWDVFLLEYKVDAPLSTVLDPVSLEGYRGMFKHLWEIKRVEYALNEGWKTLMTNTRLLKRDSAVSFDLHQTRISLSEMIFFVRQVEYYCHLEVVACQWAELETFIEKRQGGLDELVEAHRAYLRKLTEKALLKAQAKRKREVKPLVEQLRDIFKVMLQYKNVADDLFAYAMQHESYARSMSDNARDGRAPILPLRAPSVEALIALENRLADYAGQFRDKAKELVSGLERSPDLDMKFLAVRLNFNYSFHSELGITPLSAAARSPGEKSHIIFLLLFLSGAEPIFVCSNGQAEAVGTPLANEVKARWDAWAQGNSKPFPFATKAHYFDEHPERILDEPDEPASPAVLSFKSAPDVWCQVVVDALVDALAHLPSSLMADSILNVSSISLAAFTADCLENRILIQLFLLAGAQPENHLLADANVPGTEYVSPWAKQVCQLWVRGWRENNPTDPPIFLPNPHHLPLRPPPASKSGTSTVQLGKKASKRRSKKERDKRREKEHAQTRELDFSPKEEKPPPSSSRGVAPALSATPATRELPRPAPQFVATSTVGTARKSVSPAKEKVKPYDRSQGEKDKGKGREIAGDEGSTVDTRRRSYTPSVTAGSKAPSTSSRSSTLPLDLLEAGLSSSDLSAPARSLAIQQELSPIEWTLLLSRVEASGAVKKAVEQRAKEREEQIEEKERKKLEREWARDGEVDPFGNSLMEGEIVWQMEESII
ncbi:hypothetical protein JCM8547_004364 [Rhodosporidiobolus lusitaniae]